MLTLTDPRIPETYEEARALLDDQERWKVAHNTWLVDNDYNGSIGVVLHRTEIITYRRDGTVMLDSGGHQTVTTKQRMNLFTPYSIRVWQTDWEWFVSDRHGERPFEDGMVVQP